MAKFLVKEILLARGMTQQDLADKMGISKVAVNYVLNGEKTGRSVSLFTLEKMAKALDVQIGDLFERSEGVRCMCPACGNLVRMKLKIVKD